MTYGPSDRDQSSSSEQFFWGNEVRYASVDSLCGSSAAGIRVKYASADSLCGSSAAGIKTGENL